MPNEDILEALCRSIGLIPLAYICRLYIKLSNMPSKMLPSNTQTQLIKEAVNERYNINHSYEDIIMATNIIQMNKDIINRVLIVADFDQNNIALNVGHITVDILNDLILPPFTDTCVDCNRLLSSYQYKSIYIIDCLKVTRAVAITAECKKCSLYFNHSSWFSLKNRCRKVNNSSMNSSSRVFYLCDSLGFTYSVLFDYTCQLLHDHCPFQSFIKILIDRLNYEKQNTGVILQQIQLTKLFQSYWLLYRIIHFELMLGRSQVVNLPISLNRNELNNHFERYSGWWYHLFTTFWSRHKLIPDIKCAESNCSRCIIVDGHQKNRRLVCSNKNVIDTTIEEMTAIEIGCPYTPCRKKQSSDSTDPKYCRYHQPSLDISSSRLQMTHDIAAEFSRRDQQFLLEHKNQCQNYRDDSEEIRKDKTYGILASYHPCGVAIGYTEAIKAEGMRSITRHLLLMITHGCHMPDALMYDCACALKLHWNKWLGTDMLKLSNVTNQLPRYLALDNFHQRTHSRAMCQTIMKSDHPSHDGRFIGLNSQAAEQAFQYIARAKYSLRNFTYPHSTVVFMITLHLLNCKVTGINPESPGLALSHFADKIRDVFLMPCAYESFGVSHPEETNDDEENDQPDLDHMMLEALS